MTTPEPMDWSLAALRSYCWIGVVELLCTLAGLHGPPWVRLIVMCFLAGLMLRGLMSVWILGLVPRERLVAAIHFRLPIYLMGAIAAVGLVTILQHQA